MISQGVLAEFCCLVSVSVSKSDGSVVGAFGTSPLSVSQEDNIIGNS